MATKKTSKKSTKKKEAATEVVEGVDSRYRLILLAAQRSKQLQSGAKPRVEITNAKMKNNRIALEEFRQGKIEFEIIDEE
jgi:DNA-directed RNA polymerase subunit omega